MEKKKRPRDPSPGIKPLIDYATPDIRDMVFHILVDSKIATYRNPAYGSDYRGPDARFADHKLVFVTAADSNGMVKWFYAKDRADQGDYNIQYQEPKSSTGGYPGYTRTYFIARSELDVFFGELSDGDADPDIAHHPFLVDFEFVAQQISNVPDQELNSLYVLVTRHFEHLCDKVEESESKEFGRVHTTTAFTTEEPVVLPEIGDIYPVGSGRYVIDAQSAISGCGPLTKLSIATIELPSETATAEAIHPEYCKTISEKFYDLVTAYTLPEIGDAHPTLASHIVISAKADPIGQSDIRAYSITYGVFPTPPVSKELENDEFCRLEVSEHHDLSTAFTLPTKGDEYPVLSGKYVIDAKAEDIACGDVRKFSITTAVLPTPVVTKENLDNDYCRIIQESNYDLSANVGDLPLYGDAHATEVGFQVIDATIQDIGCGELRKVVKSYAEVPTDARTDESEHPEYCRLKKDSFYDLTTTYTLPAKGAVHGTGYVIDATSTSVGCGDLSKFEVSYIDLPTPVVTTTKLHDDYCNLLTETNFDLKAGAGTIPSKGAAHPSLAGYQVVDATLKDIGCGEITRVEVTYAEVPTAVRTTETEHPEFDRVSTDQFFELGAVALPGKGDVRGTGIVVDAKKTPVGCGDLFDFNISYVTMPTPGLVSTAEDENFCTTETTMHYALDGTYTLPTKGSSPSAGRYVIDAKENDIDCGGVMKYTVVTGALPSPVQVSESTHDEQCRIVTETHFSHDSIFTPPALDDAHGVDSDLKVVNVVEDPYGCGGIFKYTITYAVIPSPAKEVETEHPDYGRVRTQITYDTDGATVLPSNGSIHAGGYVIDAKQRDVNCGTLRRYEITTVALPTPPKTSEADDNNFCRTETTTHYDIGANYTLPVKGTGSPVVVEARAEDINCGDVRKFIVTTGNLPSPVKVSERTHDEQCRIITESYMDIDSHVPPLLDATHATDNTLKVVNVVTDPYGCGINTYAVTYAEIPSPAKQHESEHAQYGRVITEVTYDTDGATVLPSNGTLHTPTGGYVIEAKQKDVNCGTLRRYEVSTITLPTAARISTREDETFCTVTNETTFDLNTYTPPAKGATVGAEVVIDVQTEDIALGAIRRYTVSKGAIPSPVKVSRRTHDEQCEIVTEEYYDDDQHVIPALDAAHATNPALKVIANSEAAYGCGGIMKYSVTYAEVPSPTKVVEEVHPEYCTVTTEISYDVTGGVVLPAHGQVYGTGTGICIGGKAVDVNCGTLRRFEIQTVILPTAIITKDASHELFCEVHTDTWYAAAATPVARGAVYSTGFCIESTVMPTGCGSIYKHSVTYGAIPNTPQVGHKLNQVTGLMEPFSRKVILNADIDAEKSDVSGSGEYTSIEPFGCGLSIAATGLVKPFTTLSYVSTVTYFWPKVLAQVELMTWYIKGQDGAQGMRPFPRVEFEKEAYHGPTNCVIDEEWYLDPPAVPTVVTLESTACLYSCPVFNVNTGPCLHGEVEFHCDFGSNDPTWKSSNSSTRIVAATEYTEWPDSFIAAASVRPSAGGFILRKVTVYKPGTAPPPTPPPPA